MQNISNPLFYPLQALPAAQEYYGASPSAFSFRAFVSQPDCLLSRFSKVCLNVNIQGGIFELEVFQ
jgi:hypothetical protein